MKKLESSLKNMLLVLTGVTAISVALLAYVNELTKEPIAQANAKTLSDAVSAVVPGFDNDPIAEKKMLGSKRSTVFCISCHQRRRIYRSCCGSCCHGFGGELKVLVGFRCRRQNHRLLLVVACGNSGVGLQSCRLVQERQ